MDREEIVRRFQEIKVWKRKGVSAPHKPLLILYALGKLLRRENRLISFSEVDEKLGTLLSEFAPKKSRQGTEFPFWRLRNDGVWKVRSEGRIRENSNGDAVKSDLYKYNASGGILKSISRQLRKDTSLVCQIANDLLEAHFQSRDHERVLRAVGIDSALWSYMKGGDTSIVREEAGNRRVRYQDRKVQLKLWEKDHSDNVREEELIALLKERLPLLRDTSGMFGIESTRERIPWFIALLLSAATSNDRGACCFVLDKTSGTTAIVAALLSFVKLREEFPQMVEDYARKALQIGQRVKVNPSNHVYEYGGIWEEYPDKFRLRVLGEPKSSRSFPISEVLRLEPTERSRPKGKLGSQLGSYEPSYLDILLGLTTCGNNSVFRNSVLLYMPQASFSRAADAVALAPRTVERLEKLSEVLPWGAIGHEGELKPNDAFQVTGEPLIGVTKVPEDLALASNSAEAGTKIVLADGARGFARDLQAYDDIVDQQRVVILASPQETEALDLLKDRDCPVWHMSPEEILIGEGATTRRERTSLVGATIRAADTRQTASVVVVDCSDSILQSVAESLGRASTLVSQGEEADEIDDVLKQLHGVLLDCSECCFGIGGKTEAKLQTAQDLVARHGRWWSSNFTVEISTVIRELNEGMAGNIWGREKAHALLNIAKSGQFENWGVVTRTPQSAETLRKGLQEFGIDVPVHPISAIGTEIEYSGIVVPAWLNSQRFARLKNMAITKDIRVLAYPFEAKWVSRHQERERRRERLNQIGVEERSSILGINSRFLRSSKRSKSESQENGIDFELPIFRFEDRVALRRVKQPATAREGEDSRSAQLVQFVGDCYTLLTEWAELPRLNNLIENTDTDETGLEHVRVSRLIPGDFVLFRASEDKEFIRQIAEDILGLDEYERVRTIAELWRLPLRRLGSSTTEVQQHLESFGVKRTSTTIAGWLGNEFRIGPGDLRDIEAIARAAGDTDLLRRRDEVKSAITQIRSTHIVAGRKLTQLILGELEGHLTNLDEQPVLLSLDYGEAWVVQVDRVEAKRREYLANMVNRLLWVDDSIS